MLQGTLYSGSLMFLGPLGFIITFMTTSAFPFRKRAADCELLMGVVSACLELPYVARSYISTVKCHDLRACN